VLELEESTQPIGKSSLRYTPDGDFILSVYNNHYDVIEADSGRVVNRLVFKEAQTIGVSPNGKSVAYSSDGKNLVLWNINYNHDIRCFTDQSLIEGRAFTNYLRGIYYYNAGKHADAVKYFTATIGKTNRADKIYLLRGNSYLQMGNQKAAIDDFQKDSTLFPGRAHIHMARAYIGSKDFDKATVYLGAHINSPFMHRFNELQNDKYLTDMQSDKRWEEVKKLYKKTEGEKLIEVSEMRAKKGDLLGAMEYINRSIEMEPERADWYRERALLNLRLMQYDHAIADYKKIAELDTNCLQEMYVLIAKAYSKKGDANHAAFYLTKCFENDASQFQYLLDIASLRYSKYMKKEALDAVNKYLDIIPDDPFGYYTRAMVNDDSGQSKKDIQYAISLLQKSGEAVPKEFTELNASLE
jgi:tetratricopeptide (TPR) repeat protein